jgi:excisionase family DNA binding protein
MQNDLMTVRQLAKYIQVHEMTVYRLVKSGNLPVIKIGKRCRFLKSHIDAMATNSADQAKRTR